MTEQENKYCTVVRSEQITLNYGWSSTLSCVSFTYLLYSLVESIKSWGC